MRIFVTVGNATVGFDRLLRIVDDALRSSRTPFNGTCQVGTSSAAPRGLEVKRFLSRRAFEEEMAQADVVICHAGVGTIAAARRFGHRPFVLPREGVRGEHINDHQLELFEALVAEELIRPIVDGPALARDMTSTTRGEQPPGAKPDDLEVVLKALAVKNTTRGKPLVAVLWALSLGRGVHELEYQSK